MSLEAGRTLAHYTIVELIGKGGMGEVYRARDAKLGRDVAIKVLPHEFASDVERVARFSREARVLASLNHANIAAIHGLEETDAVHYLVLELVEGETLAERLERGALPLEEALDIALEIAAALQAAHARGVIHRDLKPANVKLTPDGEVKVLDFGLAKAIDGGEGDDDASISLSPTLARDATRVGVILGTAAYMSPEQARGKTVDKRADLWAFGVVLYEMLTGRRPFAGEDISDTLAAVLRVDPDWSALPERTPSSIRLLLERCLSKKPKDRLEDASNVRFAVEQARAEPEPGDVLSRGAVGSSRWAGWLAAFVAIAIAIAIAIVSRWDDSPPRGSVSVHPQFVPSGVSVSDVALSRDGRRLAFVGSSVGGPSRIYIRSLDELETRPLTGTEGADEPAFSPDGGWLIFSKDNAFYKLALGSGAAVRLFDNPGVATVAWSRHDDIVYSTFLGGLMRGDANGGSFEPLTTPDRATGEYMHRTPWFLPDATGVLFSAVKNATEAWVGVTSFGSSTHRLLIEGAEPKFSSQSGHLLMTRGTTLWAAAFDADRQEVVSEPIPVLDGVGRYDVAEDGSLLYVPSRGIERRQTLVWVDKDGKETPLQAPPRSYTNPHIAPDGQRIALSATVEGNRDIWVWDVRRQILSRVTFHPGIDFSPVFSPDGSRLAFHSVRDLPSVYVVPADASATATELWRGDSLVFPSHWAGPPDRLFATALQEGVMRVVQLPMEPRGEIEPVLRSPFYQIRPALSPDGRWIAYGSAESGGLNVYVRSYPDVERGRWQVSSNGGEEPQWSSDGSELFFRSPTHMMVVSIEESAGSDSGAEVFRAGTPSELFPIGGYYRPGDPQTYDVAPDGRFLFMKWEPQPEEDPALAPMVLIENWAQELDGPPPAR